MKNGIIAVMGLLLCGLSHAAEAKTCREFQSMPMDTVVQQEAYSQEFASAARTAAYRMNVSDRYHLTNIMASPEVQDSLSSAILAMCYKYPDDEMEDVMFILFQRLVRSAL